MRWRRELSLSAAAGRTGSRRISISRVGRRWRVSTVRAHHAAVTEHSTLADVLAVYGIEPEDLVRTRVYAAVDHPWIRVRRDEDGWHVSPLRLEGRAATLGRRGEAVWDAVFSLARVGFETREDAASAATGLIELVVGGSAEAG